ncbi:MAG: transporter substrate-binding domain-containing protein [Gammaproteobacteria bacterium]|nr:transporter substrate-binding domain-containing protein [Gammaproteobacteria bacterium]
MVKFFVLSGLMFLSAVSAELTYAKQEIILYSYHNSPPFLIEPQAGLTPLFVKLLNQWQKDIHFSSKLLSRLELNNIVSHGQPYFILWSNPIWFKALDNNIQSSQPLFWDSEVIISLADHPIEFYVPQDLAGLRIATLKGSRYKGIDGLVEKGVIQRVDKNTNAEGLMLLKAKKVDAVFMSRSTYAYWMQHNIYKSTDFKMVKAAQDAYSRHVLAKDNQSTVFDVINAFIKTLPNNQDWKRAVKQYGLDKMYSPFDLDLDELSGFQD